MAAYDGYLLALSKTICIVVLGIIASINLYSGGEPMVKLLNIYLIIPDRTSPVLPEIYHKSLQY
jgi:hypothetical protein